MATPRPPVASRPRKPSISRAAARKPRVTARGKAGAPPLPVPEVLYDATPRADVVSVPARKVLAIDGHGPPEGEAFKQSLQALYGVAYTLKFTRKKSGGGDFKIGPLEGRWWAEGAGIVEGGAPRETWQWRLRIGVPDDVTATEVRAAIAAATQKKGGKLERSEVASRVALERVSRQRVGRALHIGSYADEPRTFETIRASLEQAGLVPAPSHVEIYLSDPRRTPAAKLKTVLLRELA